jgi:hypothetical protein
LSFGILLRDLESHLAQYQCALLLLATGKLILRDNLLTGIIPSEIASLKSLSEFSIVVTIHCCRVFIVLSCLLFIAFSTAGLSLNNNRLTGMIPKETVSLTNLGVSSSVVWCLVMMISIVTFALLSNSHSYTVFFLILQLRWLSTTILLREPFQVRLEP